MDEGNTRISHLSAREGLVSRFELLEYWRQYGLPDGRTPESELLADRCAHIRRFQPPALKAEEELKILKEREVSWTLLITGPAQLEHVRLRR